MASRQRSQDETRQVTAIDIAGRIARAFPELKADQRDAINALFATPDSTEASLKHLLSGPGSDHLPNLKEIKAIRRGSLGARVMDLMTNFDKALGRLTIEDVETLDRMLSDRKKAAATLKSMADEARTR